MGDRKTLPDFRNQVRPPQVTQALLQKNWDGIEGSIGEVFQAIAGSVVNIHNGTVGQYVEVDNSTLNIYGGSFPGVVRVEFNSIAKDLSQNSRLPQGDEAKL